MALPTSLDCIWFESYPQNDQVSLRQNAFVPQVFLSPVILAETNNLHGIS